MCKVSSKNKPNLIDDAVEKYVRNNYGCWALHTYISESTKLSNAVYWIYVKLGKTFTRSYKRMVEIVKTRSYEMYLDDVYSLFRFGTDNIM